MKEEFGISASYLARKMGISRQLVNYYSNHGWPDHLQTVVLEIVREHSERISNNVRKITRKPTTKERKKCGPKTGSNGT